VIDIIPSAGADKPARPEVQRLVRAEVMRARYRNSYSVPIPMMPGKPSRITFELRDVCHTFPKGHRIMVQVQSSWFPLVDRNPQKFVNIYKADEADFQKATQRIYHSSRIVLRRFIGAPRRVDGP